MRLALDEIKWEPAIYPRTKWATATIDRYVECLGRGDKFPPITIEKGTSRLLDGKHRLEAHKKAECQDIAVTEVVVPDGIPVKLFAGSLNAIHGDRLPTGDAKMLARETATNNPEFNMATIADMLSFKYETVKEWVADIVQKNREQRIAWIRRLRMLGWTHGRVSQIVNNGGFPEINNSASETESVGSIEALLETGLTPADVAQRFDISLQLSTAIDFERRKLSDFNRCEELGITVQPYDVWNFAGCHDLMGDTHPGRIPGELVAHVLYFYTKPGHLVIDPMGGSGTTSDACLLLGRRGYSYDIDQHHKRPDILLHNLATNDWPERLVKTDLIFWAPPYFSKKDDAYVEGSVSGFDRKDYLAFFAKALTQGHEKVKAGTRLAFLMSDWDDPTAKEDGIFVWDYAKLIEKAGWHLIRHIQCPLSTQQVHPDIVNKFRESRRLARLERYLLVATA